MATSFNHDELREVVLCIRVLLKLESTSLLLHHFHCRSHLTLSFLSFLEELRLLLQAYFMSLTLGALLSLCWFDF